MSIFSLKNNQQINLIDDKSIGSNLVTPKHATDFFSDQGIQTTNEFNQRPRENSSDKKTEDDGTAHFSGSASSKIQGAKLSHHDGKFGTSKITLINQFEQFGLLKTQQNKAVENIATIFPERRYPPLKVDLKFQE